MRTVDERQTTIAYDIEPHYVQRINRAAGCTLSVGAEAIVLLAFTKQHLITQHLLVLGQNGLPGEAGTRFGGGSGLPWRVHGFSSLIGKFVEDFRWGDQSVCGRGVPPDGWLPGNRLQHDRIAFVAVDDPVEALEF